MFVAVFDGGHIAVANEDSKDYAVEDEEVPELIAKGHPHDRQTNTDDRNQSSDSVAESQLFDVGYRHPDVEDDD